MNVQLRKRHRLMWMAIGVGLPLLCLTAIENIPVRSIADIPRHACPPEITDCGLSTTIEISHLEAFEATISQKDSTTTIEISVVQPLKSAYTLAYIGKPEQPEEFWKLLGSIEGMGDYRFETKALLGSEISITFYDALNEQVLNSLSPTAK